VDVKVHLRSVLVQQQLGIADDVEDEEDEDDVLVLAPVKTKAGRRPIRLDDETLAVLRGRRATVN
jgi:hypothetical protein